MSDAQREPYSVCACGAKLYHPGATHSCIAYLAFRITEMETRLERVIAMFPDIIGALKAIGPDTKEA
jgi:hypothetical protein